MGKRTMNGLRIAYDKAADVLYLAFDTPKEGLDEEISAGVFVRLDAKTHRAIGVTIVDFEKRFSHPVAESVPIDLAKFLIPA